MPLITQHHHGAFQCVSWVDILCCIEVEQLQILIQLPQWRQMKWVFVTYHIFYIDQGQGVCIMQQNHSDESCYFHDIFTFPRQTSFGPCLLWMNAAKQIYSQLLELMICISICRKVGEWPSFWLIYISIFKEESTHLLVSYICT